MPPRKTTAHVLRVQLAEIEPPIWREVRVPSDLALTELHEVLQVVMPWTESHLHEFRVGKMRLANLEHEEGDMPAADERKFLLSDIAPHVGAKFLYTYDFGDSWDPEIEVTDVTVLGKNEKPIEVLAGTRASPPEDCGGAFGYETLLQAIAHPNHEEHETLKT